MTPQRFLFFLGIVLFSYVFKRLILRWILLKRRELQLPELPEATKRRIHFGVRTVLATLFVLLVLARVVHSR
jgi:hypothetical protein